MKKEEHKILYKCPQYGFKYEEKKMAKKCEDWCRKYKTCNLEITKYAKK
ncbi:MAG: hypothetical protein PHH17_00435 [Candidatus Pacebacteria bacterium]|nr:hypothetical protein [Candidatus Paceibacterota bacterium]MDD3072166.1 hypothetical protein [Candidatus Paceibacterota bacterium]MDD3728769.1 hypothetical protein [Candidatus Paceibacterota bacterium]MDD4897185.1 hypothetical protein [Candidatus Paceibacterota bacterium]MDD5445667.1 hypothetical protein [Candidatus Paceibacterota bacterium]